MEQIGTIVNVGEIQKGQGKKGDWFKHQFVLEFEDNRFMKIIALQTWGDLTDTSSTLLAGDKVNAFFNVESNEFNGKYYTNCKCWKIEVIEKSSGKPADTFKNTSDNDVNSSDLPF